MQESVQEGIGVLGKPEYAPPGIRIPQVDPLFDLNGNPLVDDQGKPLAGARVQTVPNACLLDNPPGAPSQGEAGFAPAWSGEPESCKSSGWRELVLSADPSRLDARDSMPEQRWIAGVAEHAGYLILRLRYFPAWGVRVNGIPVTATAERERGLMAVPVPPGNVQVSIDWTTTSDVVAGRCVSAVALLLVAGLYLFERKLSRAQFNMGSSTSFAATQQPNPKTARKKAAHEPKPGRSSR
jgi:hypothetical protein